MKIISQAEARRNFFEIAKAVNKNNIPVIAVNKDNNNVVIMAENEYNSLKEQINDYNFQLQPATQQAISEVKNNNLYEANSIDELMKDLNDEN